MVFKEIIHSLFVLVLHFAIAVYIIHDKIYQSFSTFCNLSKAHFLIIKETVFNVKMIILYTMIVEYRLFDVSKIKYC